MSTTSPSLQYMPQLDGLRAVAVFAVVYSHFTVGAFHVGYFGRIGVLLFFVLSGYLITSILLRYRDSFSIAKVLGSFYVRRALRLLPVYFLFLGLLLILGQMHWTALPWYLVYLQNVGYGFAGLNPGISGHLWSLAVEEQFYFIWPVVVLLSPKSYLPRILISAIVLAVVYRATVLWAMWPVENVPILWARAQFQLFGCMDSLALGSLLAVRPDIPTKIWLRAAMVALVLLVLIMWWASALRSIYLDLATALVCVYVVHLAEQGRLSRFLAAKPIVHIGKISYGVYVYHKLFQLWFPAQESATALEAAFHVLFVFALTIVVASISWSLMEAPALRLKRYFPYRPESSSILPKKHATETPT